MTPHLHRALAGWALLACVVTPAAAQAPSGREIMNDTLAEAWRTEGVSRIRAALAPATKRLEGRTERFGSSSAEILSVRRVETRIDAPPGFSRLSRDRLAFRAPLRGDWSLLLETRVKVKVRYGFVRFDKTVDVTAEVRNLSVGARVDMDSSDPTAPVIRRIQDPDVDMTVRVRTNKWYANLLLRLFDGRLNRVVREVITDAIKDLRPKLDAFDGGPGTPFGSGGPAPQVQAPTAVGLDVAAARIQADVEAYHLPFGSLTSTRFAQPYAGTWEDSLQPNGGYAPNTPTSYTKWHDSSIWTGHYLAATAARHAVTQDPDALQDAHAAVDAFDTMLRIRGTPGLLNRAIQPYAQAPVGLNADTFVTRYQGVDYVCYDFVSRDAYMGVLLGVGMAHDLIPDPALRQSAGRVIATALDYMLANDWNAYKRDGSVGVTWSTNPEQQLAWLLAGARVDPARFGPELDRLHNLSQVAWISPWSITLDPARKYYKFNLTHAAYDTLLRLETDPNHWVELQRGQQILVRALGHHDNPHFDVLSLSGDPSRAAALQPQVENALRAFLRRPRREVTIDNTNDPTIAKTIYVQTSSQFSSSPNQIPMAAFPIPIEKQQFSEFLWQRSPFRLDSSGDGRRQHPGVDFLLPYWLGRYRSAVR